MLDVVDLASSCSNRAVAFGARGLDKVRIP